MAPLFVERYIMSQVQHSPVVSELGIKNAALVQQLAAVTELICLTSTIFYNGTPRVSQYFAVQDQKLETKQRVLQLAASLAVSVNDRYFQSIVRAATESNLPLREIDTDAITGGVMGKLERTWYVLGDEFSMRSEGIGLGVTGGTLAGQLQGQGRRILFLAQKQPKRLLGIFACEQTIIETGSATIAQFSQLPVEVILVTSQNTRSAQALADTLGIASVYSELNRDETVNLTSALHNKYPHAAFIMTPESALPMPPATLSIMIGDRKVEGTTITVHNLDELHAILKWCKATIEATKKRFFWYKI